MARVSNLPDRTVGFGENDPGDGFGNPLGNERGGAPNPLGAVVGGLGPLSSFAGGILGAVGVGQKANAAARDLEFKADQADKNVRLILKDINFTREQTNDALFKQKIMARRIFGSQKTAFSASGVTLQGSALDVLRETRTLASMDRANILKGETRAIEKLNAQKFEEQLFARRARKSAKETRQAGEDEALGTFLGGFGKAVASIFG